ncbi:arsenate reductase ArsC [Hyphococcus flavus]|uniref:Arsenate reductase ArsC n=1 Tax=Hyphococcus flavus TaxID=1866326 RepID=A0AAE9ZI19_9PROT|nr:arsenate reductase ArsC [Hyphococcus flavus]WDI33007.1 arsenate reductase ArsC [Hyphococcus flavus]
MKNILFLCTGNSARSIMAEGYMNHAGRGRWRAWSAGSTPTGKVNPFAIETLVVHGIEPPEDARSKTWDEFAAPDAPVMNAVVTVCDNAASEVCPIWPTRDGEVLKKLHWSFPDPAAATGSNEEIRAAFAAVFDDIRTQIDAYLKQS